MPNKDTLSIISPTSCDVSISNVDLAVQPIAHLGMVSVDKDVLMPSRVNVRVSSLLGRQFEVLMDSSQDIATLKRSVEAAEQFLAEEQRFIFKGKELKDHELLGSLAEADSLHVYLVLRAGSSARLKVRLQTLKKERFSVNVTRAATVAVLKERIFSQGLFSVRPDEMRLILRGRKLVDSDLLIEHQLNDSSVILITKKVVYDRNILIQVTPFRSVPVSLSVKGSNTVADVKQMMNQRIGQDLDKMKVFYRGRVLDNNLSLSQQHVDSDASLLLLPNIQLVAENGNGAGGNMVLNLDDPDQYSELAERLFAKELRTNLPHGLAASFSSSSSSSSSLSSDVYVPDHTGSSCSPSPITPPPSNDPPVSQFSNACLPSEPLPTRQQTMAQRNKDSSLFSGLKRGFLCGKSERSQSKRSKPNDYCVVRGGVRQAGNPCFDGPTGHSCATGASTATINKENESRCKVCLKKIGILLAMAKCRCGELYCRTHRVPTRHDCPFDYQSMHQQTLEKSNPKICPSKVEKL